MVETRNGPGRTGICLIESLSEIVVFCPFEFQMPVLAATVREITCKRTISETDKGVSRRAQTQACRVDQS